MYEKREKPFSSCHDGSKSSPQSLMEKICEVDSSNCSFVSSISLFEGIMGFFRQAGDGKSVKQRPWYDSLSF
jgi:hypothetical protein